MWMSRVGGVAAVPGSLAGAAQVCPMAELCSHAQKSSEYGSVPSTAVSGRWRTRNSAQCLQVGSAPLKGRVWGDTRLEDRGCSALVPPSLRCNQTLTPIFLFIETDSDADFPRGGDRKR